MSEVIAWNWSGIIQSIAALAMVFIAYRALTEWRNQHKAEKITSFFDELTDIIHEYIQLLGVPIQQLQFIKIHIESHKFDLDLKKELEYPEVVAFIENYGQEEAKKLQEALTLCNKPLSKIRSLLVKGQVFSIENYQECQNACNMLTWQYDRLQAFYAIISSINLNWKNEKVIEYCKNVLELTSEDIEQHISENQIEYIRFVQNTYNKVYKNA